MQTKNKEEVLNSSLKHDEREDVLNALVFKFKGDYVEIINKMKHKDDDPVDFNKKEIDKYLKELELKNIKYITLTDHFYPDSLKRTSFPPLIFYTNKNANLQLLKTDKTCALFGDLNIVDLNDIKYKNIVCEATKANIEFVLNNKDCDKTFILIEENGLDSEIVKQFDEIENAIYISEMPPIAVKPRNSFIDRIMVGLNDGKIYTCAKTNNEFEDYFNRIMAGMSIALNEKSAPVDIDHLNPKELQQEQDENLVQ